MSTLARQLADLKARHPAPATPDTGLRETMQEVEPLPLPAPARARKMGVVAGGRPAKRATKGASYVNQANAVRYRRINWLSEHSHEMGIQEMRIAVELIRLGGWRFTGTLEQLGKPAGMNRHHTHESIQRLARLGLVQERRTRAGKRNGWDILVK